MSRWLLLNVVLAFGLLTSCGISKHLSEDEFLLTENKIIFPEGKIENNKLIKAELATLYKQTPNSNWLFFVKVPTNFYFWNERTERDSTEDTNLEAALRRLINKRIAEPPAIYQQKLAETTRDNMKFYLRNKGYFDAEVSFSYQSKKPRKKDVIPKEVKVTYEVFPGKRYMSDSIVFVAKDSNILNILNRYKESSKFWGNKPIDSGLYDAEVTRIINLMRNSGYADFTSNYVDTLSVDTSKFVVNDMGDRLDTVGQKTVMELEILNPNNGGQHEVYTIGEVVIGLKYLDSVKVDLVEYGDLIFRKKTGTKFKVKPKAIEHYFEFKPGEIYNQRKINLTNNRLTQLDIFRFVSLNAKADSLNRMNFDISLNHRKKWETGFDIEPNFTERNVTSDPLNLFGLSTSLFLGNNNLLRGAESLNSSAFFGIERNLDRINAFEIRLTNEVNIPRHIDYLGLYKGLKKIGVVRSKFYKNLKRLSPTRISLGYNYLDLYDLYRYHLFNASYGYDIKPKNNRYILKNLGIDLLRPTTQPIFDTLLLSSPFLANSFGDQLFTGFLLREFNFIRTTKESVHRESYYFQLFSELSGLEILAANNLYNSLSGNNEEWRLGNDLEFSQYVKFEIDGRYNKRYSSKLSLATRINVGIARPFGNSNDVPYVKQFYSGGPQSIRAWGARGLGPGSYSDPLNSNPNNRLLFYQTGDFKFEMNGELRFFVTRIWAIKLEGAYFLDIGNVWTINEDPGRPGSQLQWRPTLDQFGNEVGDNFFKEMAVGHGIGSRFDFSYFLLRFDIGYPLKNPFLTELPNGNSTYWSINPQVANPLRLFNFNLGINYPF